MRSIARRVSATRTPAQTAASVRKISTVRVVETRVLDSIRVVGADCEERQLHRLAAAIIAVAAGVWTLSQSGTAHSASTAEITLLGMCMT